MMRVALSSALSMTAGASICVSPDRHAKPQARSNKGVIEHLATVKIRRATKPVYSAYRGSDFAPNCVAVRCPREIVCKSGA